MAQVQQTLENKNTLVTQQMADLKAMIAQLEQQQAAVTKNS